MSEVQGGNELQVGLVQGGTHPVLRLPNKRFGCCLVGCVGRLVDRLVRWLGWLVGLLVDLLVGWFLRWLGWLVVFLVGRLVGRLVPSLDPFVGLFVCWLVAWFVGRSVGRCLSCLCAIDDWLPIDAKFAGKFVQRLVSPLHRCDDGDVECFSKLQSFRCIRFDG